MNRRYCAFFIFFLLIAALRAIAQPTLPDIAATSDNGAVTLSWSSQYDKIKAITVMRSSDSLSDFEVIGYVKKRDKGIQSYTDNTTNTGKYYYKLAIIFNSGLTWRSNFTGVTVSKTITEKPKPVIEKESDKPLANEPKPKPAHLESSFSAIKKISDSALMAVTSNSPTVSQPEKPRPKIKLSYDEEPDNNAPILLRSKYIHTDSITGHIDLWLPDDVSTHSYSLKFYDKDKRLVTEIPKINSQKIIIDKRNFQRKGVYKFTIRKDYTELESGYIIINPAQ